MNQLPDPVGLSLLPWLGRLFLYLRYPNPIKRKLAFEKHYGADYTSAGSMALVFLFVLIFLLALGIFIGIGLTI